MHFVNVEAGDGKRDDGGFSSHVRDESKIVGAPKKIVVAAKGTVAQQRTALHNATLITLGASQDLLSQHSS